MTQSTASPVLYLWEHDSQTPPRVASVEDARSFTNGNPRWVRCYPVELVGASAADRAELAAEAKQRLRDGSGCASEFIGSSKVIPLHEAIAIIDALARSTEPAADVAEPADDRSAFEAAHKGAGYGAVKWNSDGDRPLFQGDAARYTGWQMARALARSTDAPSEPRLPHPASPLASDMMDAVLAEYHYPSNSKNAARAGFEAARRILATPPAASTSAQGDAEKALLEEIDNRDAAMERAQELADAIAKYLGVYIGEHTSGNDPWENALLALYEAAPPAARGTGAPSCGTCEHASLEVSQSPCRECVLHAPWRPMWKAAAPPAASASAPETGTMEDFGEAATLVSAVKAATTNGEALGLVLAYRKRVRALAATTPAPACRAEPATDARADELQLTKLMEASCFSEIRAMDDRFVLVFQFKSAAELFAAEDELRAYRAALAAATPQDTDGGKQA